MASTVPHVQIRTSASDVRVGMRVWPRVRPCKRPYHAPAPSEFVSRPWIAEARLPDGYLLIRRGRKTQRLSRGVVVLCDLSERLS